MSYYYQKYYIIAFLLIFLSSISFFIPKKLKINITIVFIATLIGLYFIEGYLLMQNIKQDKFVIYKTDTGKDYDKRTKFDIYQDLKKEEPNIAVMLEPSLFLDNKNLSYLPLSGISNHKTIFCNEGGYYSIFQSDRYGFNNPDDEWDKEQIEFLLVGDSFTLGACVNEPDTISGNLKKLIDNKNGILNLGQAGDGPLFEYATLREYLPVKKVKRVLWVYYENDLGGLKKELKNQILVNYLKDKSFTQNLILRKQEIQKILLNKLEQKELEIKRAKQHILESERLERKRFFELIRFAKLFFTREMIGNFYYWKIKFQYYSPAHKKEFKNILKLSNEFIKQNNSKLYFVYLGNYYRYVAGNNQDGYMYYKEVIQIVENLNIPIIDINELFEKHEDPLSLFPFRKRNHYNEKGYQLIAKTIFEKINGLEK
jgi:hypothetical protein